MGKITLGDWINSEDDMEDEEVSFENIFANIKDEDAEFTFDYIYSIVNSEEVNNPVTTDEGSYSYSYNNNNDDCKTDKEKRLEELARHGISPGRPNKTQQRKLVLFERELRSRGYSKKEIDKVIKNTIDYITS